MGWTNLRDRLEDSRTASKWAITIGYTLFLATVLVILLSGNSTAVRAAALLIGVVGGSSGSWGLRNLREIRAFEASSRASLQPISRDGNSDPHRASSPR